MKEDTTTMTIVPVTKLTQTIRQKPIACVLLILKHCHVKVFAECS